MAMDTLIVCCLSSSLPVEILEMVGVICGNDAGVLHEGRHSDGFVLRSKQIDGTQL